MLNVCLLKEANCLSVPSWSQVWAGISWKEGAHEEGDSSALGLLPSLLRWAVAWLSFHLLQAPEHPQVCRRGVGLGREQVGLVGHTHGFVGLPPWGWWSAAGAQEQ